MKTAWGKKAVCAALALFAALVWMPAAFADSAQYLGEDGQMYTQENAAPVQQGDTEWGKAGGETWYVAKDTVEITGRVKVTGSVHLILANGANLTVDGGIEVSEGNSFTVYAQSTDETQMGSLTATAREKGDGAGIGGNNAPLGEDSRYTGAGGTAGSITIHGGKVTATGAEGSAGIGGGAGGEAAQTGGTIKITGGVVNATGGASAGYSTYSGAGIGGGELGTGGEVTITGGKVTATGGNNTYGGAGIGGGDNGSGGTITITGGKVTAQGGGTNGGGAGIGGGYHAEGGAIAITGGEVTATGGGSALRGAGIGGGNGENASGRFSVSGAGTVVRATSIGDQTGKANWQGIVYEGGTGRVYGSVELGRNFENPAGSTLSVPSTGTLAIPVGVTLTNKGTLNILEGGALTNNGTLQNNGLVCQVGTYTGDDATGNGTWVNAKGNVLYLDKDGGQKTHTALPVQADRLEWGTEIDEMWYVAEGDIDLTGRVKVAGSVHLILANGAKLTVSEGIEVGAGNSFTVYAQTKEETQMGSLTATGGYGAAGIGGSIEGSGGTVTVYGGVVNATGGGDAAGIGGGYFGDGGTVTVYGGVVNAMGGAGIGGAGIGGDGGTVTVYGGEVTATGSYGAAGIGDTAGSGGTVTVYGGTVTATGGGNSGAGIKSKVTVYGGTVTATGGGNGAGIVDSNAVTVYGGTVTITGGTSAYGIGGPSWNSTGGAMEVYGGEVTVTGGKAAIEKGSNSSLTISPAAGWSIEAKAGESAAAATALSGSPFAPGTQTDVIGLVQGQKYFASTAQKLPDEEKPAQDTGSTQATQTKQNPQTGV